MADFIISYTFNTENGPPFSYHLVLDEDSMEILQPQVKSHPQWTKLSCSQCASCPLIAAENDHCPAASNLLPLTQLTADFDPSEKAEIRVDTPQRSYLINATVQQGLSSLMGLIFAVSGCPITAFFRPMARFHLPFANDDETLFRACSTYLVQSYFKGNYVQDTRTLFDGLQTIYQDINELNKGMAGRLKHIDNKQATTRNAMVLLDSLSKHTLGTITEVVKDLQTVF